MAISKVTPERLMQFAFGYAPPLMIEAGVRLGLFETLSAGPKSLRELCAATGAAERGVRILLNALVGLELISVDSQQRYALTEESAAFLDPKKSGYHGGFFKHASTQLIPKWLALTEIVRTGKPAGAVNAEDEGSAFFEQFVEDIFPLSYGMARVLAQELQLPEATAPVSVLDLAAGSGVWGIGLAEASPLVRVTAVDWAAVLPATERIAMRHGVADRFQFVPGDLADADFGTGHHIATLGHILHSEGAARSQSLLKKTFVALNPGGTIAIQEFLVNADRTGPPNGLIFAVNMLVNTEQGDTFTFEEISTWLRDAGFINPRLLEGPGPSPLVLATKP